MKFRTFAIAASTLALGLATWLIPVKAQGPMFDRVNVNLPYTVTIGDKTLQPGDYVIQELDNRNNSRVLLIYSDSGMKFETSALTIPTVNNRTPEDTKVVLHHFGQDYYFDKVWIQGKDYGYEFPLPNAVKERQTERMEPVSVAATYQAVPAPTTTAQTSAPATTTPETTTAPATQPATTAQETTPPATTAPQTMQPETTAPATSAPSTMPPADTSSANREMPATSAGWLMMLLGGGVLSGAGMTLRRKR